ncbi:hypothetical protein GCM10018785_35740 [Streptomyces longispororuber]|uniref:Uncharacterized protein n=1 Tax=Streptomyces longispororuber TaxID=68230 RepID=A0A918ZP85_9ACTN|nr:hypothetical protein [Streptomyces longispororuber]GHE63708.1 hypothetical protein GCM10018785_35740 [Streptomyces longispororuber]
MASRGRRLSIALALSASALLTVTGPAAAKDPLPADIPDYQAALDAVKSTTVRNAVCRFLSVPVPTGNNGGTPSSQPIPDKADPCEGLPAFTVKDPVALNEVTPGFAAGTARPIATKAVKLTLLVAALNAPVNGRNATVMLAPTQGGGWHLAAVREGDEDAAQASKATVGTLVFTEPQIRGWYRLKLTTVEPLNDAARQGLDGRPSVSLSEYQNLVKARTADRLPGSEFDTKGFSSGSGPEQQAGRSTSTTPLIIGGSGAALALAGGTLLIRRRRATSH